jgi:RNA polymerase sigma factor (sigma-70 family)
MNELIIQRILDGDKEAFRKIISEYKDMAFSIAMSVIKEEFSSAEIVQVSFIKAYDNLSYFRGESKFSTWFYRIVVNESFKFIKKQKTEIIDFVDNPLDSVIDIDHSFLKLDEDEQKYFINEALNKISFKESLILRLFYLEENSIEEICNITGWTGSNIKVILHRARINLKRILADKYNIDKKILYK